MKSNMNLFGRDMRSAKLGKNIGISLLCKMVVAIVIFLQLPLILKCLGGYVNGVWLTISSLLVWIDQMDLGLGNGLRNKLAVHIAHKEYDRARQVVVSTFAMLFCIAVFVAVLSITVLWTADIYSFFNVTECAIPELRTALTSAVILVCMTFVMKLIGNVYMGMQMPAMSNLILAVGQIIALFSTWLLYIMHLGNFLNIVVVNTAAPLVAYLAAYPYTFRFKFPFLRPSICDINLETALKLGNLGLSFFWLQIAGLVQFCTANILISKFFTPEMVTPYQITYRYISLILVVYNIVCMPVWNATTDAFEKMDMEWIRKTDRRMGTITIIALLSIATMLCISPLVYDVWIDDLCSVPFSMTIMMAIYVSLIIISTRYSTFLNGIGALRMQMYMSISAVIFIPLAWVVSVKTQSITGLMAVMCICLIPGLIANKIQFKKILDGRAKGIWGVYD